MMKIVGPEIEPTPRWIKVKFGSEFIANSKRCLLLRRYDTGILPTYYFPKDDVNISIFKKSKSEATLDWYDVVIPEKSAQACAWEVTDSKSKLNGYMSFAWNKMDAWYEEAEEVFVHARDPYNRVDTLFSNRHVRIELEGMLLAESTSPVLLFETNLPVRYYLLQSEMNMDLLIPTTLQTRCPYKGEAVYWSVDVNSKLHENIVWSYPDPIAECPKIKHRLCFYNEKVDVIVDGELQSRPQSPWS